MPSPFGLKGHDVILRTASSGGYLGELREVQVHDLNAALADPAAPLSWRQDVALSGFNMLTLGILHETLLRWVPPPVRVLAQVHAFIPPRIDPESGVRRPVGTPDSVQVLAELENGGSCGLSLQRRDARSARTRRSVCTAAKACCITTCSRDRLTGASKQAGKVAVDAGELEEIPIPPERGADVAGRGGVRRGDPRRQRRCDSRTSPTGVAYMEFTEAVARSAERGEAVELPLAEFVVNE